MLQAAQDPLVATLETRAATAESKLATAIAIIDSLAARLRVAEAAAPAESAPAARPIVRPTRHVHHREPPSPPAIVKIYQLVPMPTGSILSVFA